MKIIRTELPGILILEPPVFKDDRGFFFESYSQQKYSELLRVPSFVQDNISRSSKDTLRGLHFQKGEYAQGKLCSVLEGKVLDIAVDLRRGSPAYGKHVAVELSSENKLQIWIPAGFAHGFSVLSETALFQYKCTQYYHRPAERCLLYNDPALQIDWKVAHPILSMKDAQGALLKDLDHDFTYSAE